MHMPSTRSGIILASIFPNIFFLPQERFFSTQKEYEDQMTPLKYFQEKKSSTQDAISNKNILQE